MKTTFTFIISFCFSTIILAQWVQVGGAVQPFSNNASFSVIGSTPVAAYTDIADNGKIFVKKFENNNWVQIGGEVTSTLMSFVNLKIDNGQNPYVAYLTLAGGVNVKSYNGTDWVQVGLEDFANAYEMKFDIDGDDLYVAFSDVNHFAALTVMKFNGTSWVEVGDPGFSTAGTDFLSFSAVNSNLFLGFRDFGDPNQGASVVKFNDAMQEWELVGQSGFTGGSSQYNSLDIAGETLAIAYSDGTENNKLSVMSYNMVNENWEYFGMAGISEGIAQFSALTLISGNPYVAFNDDFNADLTSIYFFNGTDWDQLGDKIGEGFTTEQSLFRYGSILYCGFVDLASNVVLYSYDLGCDIVEINANIQDVLCNGGANGSIEVNIENAAEPITYSWSNGSMISSISDLIPGDYSLSIIDALGCQVVNTFQINEPAPVSITIDEVIDQTGQSLNGSISITASGGDNSGYTYSWTLDGTPFETLEDLTGLEAGEYCVTVTDVNGCSGNECVTVNLNTSTTGAGFDHHFLVYPNPVNGFLFLESKGIYKTELRVEIINNIGQLKLAEDLAGNGTEKINLNGFSSGIYFIRTKVEGKVLIKKIVLID